MTNTIPEQLPPLVELTQEQEIARILDQLVKEKGEDYIYPHAGHYDDNGNMTESGQCQYVESVTGDTTVIYWDSEGAMVPLPVERLQPSCLIGHLAVRLGVPIRALLSHNEENFTQLFSYEPSLQEALHGVSPDTITALGEMQNAQDKGHPWGKAVSDFKNAVAA